MFKKYWLLLLTLLASAAHADEASLRKAIESAYPKMSVESIVKTPYSGLYEVYMSGQIVYTDEKFSFLIAEGHLVDSKSKKDVTTERLADLSKIDFDHLPFDQAIKVVKGNGSRKMAVFSDVDCPFCKRLEQNELSIITDVTIYTFLMPLDQLHPDAANKSKAIWCAAVAVVLIILGHKWKQGQVFSAYVFAYCVGRFFIESIRIDEAHTIAGLRVNVWVSAIIAISSLAYFARASKNQR